MADQTHGNGAKSPIPFPGAPNDIPIVGQPYKLKGVMPQALLQCSCDAKEPVLLIGMGAQGQCPSCRRAFVLSEVHGVAGGQVSASIAVGVPKPGAED